MTFEEVYAHLPKVDLLKSDETEGVNREKDFDTLKEKVRYM